MAVSIFKLSDGPVVSNRHLLFLLFAGMVGAVPGRRSAQDVARHEWKPAVPTGTATDNTKWTHLQQSHRPTDAPRHRGHHALPAVFAEDLRKRELSIVSYDSAPVGSNTCGFYTDDGSPLYCFSGYSCANIGNIRDCCAGKDCETSSFSSVCLDYTNPACSSFTPGTRCCGGPNDPQAAYCATYLWATSENPREIFTLFECEEKQFAGNFSLWAEKPIFVSDYVPASTTSRAPLPIPSSPESSGTSGSSNAGSGSKDASGSANGGLNVGAVVGGVIGGVALVGVFLLVFYYMRIRGRKAVAAAAAAAAAKVAAEKAHGNGNGSDGGSGPYGNGNGSTHMMGVGGGMHSPPPPSESFWGGSGSGNGGSGGGVTNPTISSASPATVANSTSAILTPEQQPLVQNQYTPQQMQEWQAFQLQQQYNLFQQQQQQGLGQQGQWVAPQDPRRDVQQMHAMQQQEETDRGMAIGMAMGMNMMVQQPGGAAKEKSPIEMSNSPTSYEVSTGSLYQELDGNKGGHATGWKELPG